MHSKSIIRASDIVPAQNSSTSSPLRDPRELYLQNVTLPPPYRLGNTGLQSEFDPPPDCGEDSYVGSGRLAGRRALITGGDSGIGRAVAIAFAREGADVTINYLPDEQSDAEDVRSIIESTTDSRVFTLPGDIRNETFCEQLVADAAVQMEGIDILINNAGWTQLAPNITTLSTEVFRRTLETNVFAPFYITRAAVPYMPPGSSIVFTASRIVESPPYEGATYASTKAFLATYSRALAFGLMQQNGIRVNAVAPGIVYTPFLPTQGLVSEIANDRVGTLPMGRVAQPVEVATLYVGLVENAQTHAYGAVWEL